MDGYATRLHEGGSDSEDQALLLQRQRQRQAHDQSLIQSRRSRQGQMQKQQRQWPQTRASPPPLEFHRSSLERLGASNLRSSSFRVDASPRPGRSITPDLPQGHGGAASAALSGSNMAHPSSSRGAGSQQGSPRSVPAAASVGRRQGVVFAGDALCDSSDGTDSSPATTTTHQQRNADGPPIRPRTRTMDASMLGPRGPASAAELRHRVSSVSSGSQPSLDDHKALAPSSDPSSGYYSIPTVRVPEISTPAPAPAPAWASASASRDKSKSSSSSSSSSHHNRRLLKRHPSRPTSPLVAPQPSVDSFPHPVPADDAGRLISLMKALGGRMRGELEYQGEYQGTWHTGMAYIDEEKGTLMFGLGHSGHSASFHIPLVSDLRGCRVHVTGYPDAERECLEVVPSQPGLELLLRPVISEELELWLAALLCWQQLTPLGLRVPNGKPASPAGAVRPENQRRRAKSSDAARATNTIKVGKFMLWDKGPAGSARAVVQRSSTRDLAHPYPSMSWRRISCALQENGEFRLLMENDVSVLSAIELSQLSRCAIQGLDRTVLEEEYCLAIFPIYAPAATHVSVFRPVYLAVDTRIDFEVWFALLRTFAVPDIFCLDDPQADEIQDVADIEKDQPGEVFRMEKIIRVRVVEAKIKANPVGVEWFSPEKCGRIGPDPLVGCYLAEVILDGEVRARTTTKTDTKNPFWREDCEFNDLPPIVQDLSVVLKRVERGGSDGYSKSSAAAAAAAAASTQEVMCGSVRIGLDDVERGQGGQESWQPILDDKQQNIGSMLIKVFHDEHVALLSKEYEPLSEILHRFPTGLTTLISTSLPGQLRALSELFLNIFQASGSAGDWLMALVEDEIDGIGDQASIKKYRFSNRLRSSESMESSNEREVMVRDIHRTLAGEANLLFRGNSLLTQSLEFHMRRLGKEYLEEILQDKIYEINELNPDCEVDPSKLAHTGGDLDQHWGRLIHLTTEIWLCIADSAERIPAELRHVLKYIRAVADDRYSDFLRSVSYTSISGFLFLRFICPAILSPKLFGLLRDHPRPQAQRTLTLIAKALQKLSNLSTFGRREEWMEPMNRFLTQQRQTFRGFIDQVCGIPADRGTRALPPSYIAPVTILNRLEPMAREGFPSLPYLIDQARSFASLVKLWVDSRPVGVKHGHVDGELLIFNDLCFGLQKRADACLAKVVDFRNREAPSHMSPEQLAEILEQVNFTGPYHPYYVGSPSAVAASYERPPGSPSSDGAGDSSAKRRSKEWRRGRDEADARKGNSPRNASGSASGNAKQKNAKATRI
ncbi:bud2-gtpase-activating for bud1p rsr1p [Trichoderma cornu-damae]|uniref:Bud2-gtpase-activating for bud1p rsr1p n=1 Tax=Trichoderma cornu-damae TaxID=654480 RepID=A0A9P8TTR2_9HYPO|nr:bud2-gtpase-activating for bud1p rsr1p [Trichoderma cornu-damae]